MRSIHVMIASRRSSRVDQRWRSSTFFCSKAKKDSIAALSPQAPIGLLDGLWDKADRYRRAALETREDSPDDRARVQAEHQAIMTAVLDGDHGAAEEHMRRHVANSLGRRAIDILTGDESPGPTAIGR